MFQVHRIRENPVLFLLNSIAKLKPDKGFVCRSYSLQFLFSNSHFRSSIYPPPCRFYPMLDVDQLYKILTTEKSLLLANPQLAGGSNEELDERTVRKYFHTKSSTCSVHPLPHHLIAII